MRLLWVEDHALFVRVAGTKFLSGHVVTVVPSLADAERALAEQTFDVVLLDYDLADGKGTSLFAFIEQLPVRPAVLACSAHAAGNEALRQAGADGVCAKGSFAEVEAMLARVVGKVLDGAPKGREDGRGG
jgi:CheY-like chemotaxis protein